MKKENKPFDAVSRRKFIGSTLAISAGLMVGNSKIIAAPAIIRNLGKPDSVIKGVQIGVITYSFRSMSDQSAEATLNYILQTGLSAIELMGEPAESFAGIPINPVDRSVFFGLMRKTREGGQLTDDEKKQMEDMRAQMDAYNKEVAQWRGSV